MSISAVSSIAVSPLQEYYHQRAIDLKQLGQDLQSGNTSAAQQDFNNIQTLAQSGPFPNGEAFALSWRQQDFNNIGQALQSGDLAGAQQAFAELAATFGKGRSPVEPSPAASGPTSGSGLNVNA